MNITVNINGWENGHSFFYLLTVSYFFQTKEIIVSKIYNYKFK